MKADTRTDLAGILVGTVMKGAPPLVFYLYTDGPVKRHTRVVVCQKCAASLETVTTLAQTYAAAVVDIWTNRMYPCWYFIQLKRNWKPGKLRVFGLPWSVYNAWRQNKRIP